MGNEGKPSIEIHFEHTTLESGKVIRVIRRVMEGCLKDPGICTSAKCSPEAIAETCHKKEYDVDPLHPPLCGPNCPSTYRN